MKLIKIDVAYINPEAVDMIYSTQEYMKEETSILLRSREVVHVQARVEEVKRAFTEGIDLPLD